MIICINNSDFFSVLQAKALYYQETLCRKEDIQKFLSSLVSKKPEVGHLVKCFHVSKSADAKTNSGNSQRLVQSRDPNRFLGYGKDDKKSILEKRENLHNAADHSKDLRNL